MPPELAYPEAGRIGTALLGAASKERLSGTQGAVRSLQRPRAGAIGWRDPPVFGTTTAPSA